MHRHQLTQDGAEQMLKPDRNVGSANRRTEGVQQRVSQVELDTETFKLLRDGRAELGPDAVVHLTTCDRVKFSVDLNERPVELLDAMQEQCAQMRSSAIT